MSPPLCAERRHIQLNRLGYRVKSQCMLAGLISVDGLVNPVLVWTDLVRIKRSGLVNQFDIGTNRTGPYILNWFSQPQPNIVSTSRVCWVSLQFKIEAVLQTKAW